MFQIFQEKLLFLVHVNLKNGGLLTDDAARSTASKPRQAMMATIFTVLMNIVLDFIFIRLWGWGIRGAAFATVLSQALALCWQMKQLTNKDEISTPPRGVRGPRQTSGLIGQRWKHSNVLVSRLVLMGQH